MQSSLIRAPDNHVAGWLLSRLLDVLLIFVAVFIIALKFQEYFSVNLVLLISSLLYLSRNLFSAKTRARGGSLNLLDFSLSLVVLNEIFNYFQSSYRPNSFLSLTEILFLFLFYWLLRLNLTQEYQRTTLFIFVTLVGVFIAVVTFKSFPELYWRLRELGFDDLTSFRNHIYMFTPIGLSIGEWSTVLLLLVPFPIILIVKYREHRYVRWLLTLITAAILLAIVLTFTRGLYIAAAVFFVVGSVLFWIYQIFPPRRIVIFNLTIILLLLVGIIPVWRPALVTLSLFRTTSQVRSFEARGKVWKDSLRIVRDYPLTGVGAGNFTMKYVGYRSTSDEAAFVLRPFNFLLHILVERGFVGILAYGFLFLSFIFVSYRKLKLLRGDPYKQSIVLLFVTAVIAMLVREMSDSSMFINHAVGVLLCLIFATIAGSHEELVTDER